MSKFGAGLRIDFQGCIKVILTFGKIEGVYIPKWN